MSAMLDLRRKLDECYAGRYELDVGAGRTAILLVVDDVFRGLDRDRRLALVEPLLVEAGLQPGLTELYTSAEAAERGIAVSTAAIAAPATWDEAVSLVESGQQVTAAESFTRRPRRIVFYSYKGGVGRTTALVHTAFHLARGGLRVVVVDMDVEAPGLHTVLPRPDGEAVTAGLVDYLWERQVRPFDSAPGEGLVTCLVETVPGQQAIAYAVEDPVSHAPIHVIPAGAVGGDYVRRLATLSSHHVLSRPDDAWSLFEKEMMEQLEPDVMLIDARTGLGDWGGLSLLRLADEAFLVLFPSDQNAEGVLFVRRTLADLTAMNTHIVLSPLPEGPVGRALADQVVSRLDLEEGEQVEIHYNPGIASARLYPVEAAMADYARLASLVRDRATESQVEDLIRQSDRWAIIESLKFPERDAKTIAAADFELFFQKTSDFDKLLDDARWVVRGRKGTGKSTLFHLFVEHLENAAKRAKGRLVDIDILPGHGPAAGARLRPTTDEFAAIQRGLASGRHDWLSLWRAYAIIRIFALYDGLLVDSLLKRVDMKPLREHLRDSFQRLTDESWRSSHTTALLRLVEDPLNGLCRDFIGDLNGALGGKGRKLWLLYDDLDQDILEQSKWQVDALGGLLRLAYDSNNLDLHQIRFKIFLREDIWSRLVFTNKSHFGEPRTLDLQWRIDDFLRLAYRLATGGSPEFRTLAQREFPLPDREVDSASEEALRQALAPLWGMNQERGKKALAARWVYSRMTDARDNTYPRSLTVLLNAARDEELRVRNEKQAPTDRLLSPRAMQAGLKAASMERVNALKNEYPTLRPFLEDVEGSESLRSQFKRDDLTAVWKRTAEDTHPSFDSFVAQLAAAGLIMVKKEGSAYDYGIASLYIDGLGIRRVQGEKK